MPPFPLMKWRRPTSPFQESKFVNQGEMEELLYTTILETEVSANLLDLTNGVTENLASVEIPAGSYDQVRVYVSDASIVLKNGTDYDLTVPSGASTGIKVFINPDIEVVGGLTAELLLDVNVSQSFIPLGPPNNPHQWI